jgi:hypothetical protein
VAGHPAASATPAWSPPVPLPHRARHPYRGFRRHLAELETELAGCGEGVLRHHCPGHDFSRWVADVFHDGSLATDLAAAEAAITRRSPSAVVEQVRLTLIAALQDRPPAEPAHGCAAGCVLSRHCCPDRVIGP